MNDPVGHVSYPEAAFADLYEHEAGHFWFRARNQLILWALSRFGPGGEGRFLEIGCGTGFVLSAIETCFPQWSVAGSEVLSEGLTFARRRVARAELFQMDARSIPFEGAFDAIGAFDVLEHIADDEQVLRQIHRALKPGGCLFVTVPQHMWLWSDADTFAGHVRRYERRELLEKVRRAGFTIRRCHSFVSLLLPLMALARLKPTGAPYDPLAEFRLPPALNAAFERVLAFERGLIQRGLSFPAGGSLLVIASRE